MNQPTATFTESARLIGAAQSRWGKVALLVAWVVALRGVLALHSVEGWIGHSICGPWGCGPPGEALLSYHLFWVLLICPVALLVAGRLTISSAHTLGLAMLLAGAIATVCLLGWAAVDWLIGPGGPHHVVQRALFVVATTVDLPALQVLLAGLLCLVVSRRRDQAVRVADERLQTTDR